jgi:hypothetical protein
LLKDKNTALKLDTNQLRSGIEELQALLEKTRDEKLTLVRDLKSQHCEAQDHF